MAAGKKEEPFILQDWDGNASCADLPEQLVYLTGLACSEGLSVRLD